MGRISDDQWSPHFTCQAAGQAIIEFMGAHPDKRLTVLCGHSHGVGTYRPVPNLEVRTGGWPKDTEEYGNPVVQATLEL